MTDPDAPDEVDFWLTLAGWAGAALLLLMGAGQALLFLCSVPRGR